MYGISVADWNRFEVVILLTMRRRRFLLAGAWVGEVAVSTVDSVMEDVSSSLSELDSPVLSASLS